MKSRRWADLIAVGLVLAAMCVLAVVRDDAEQRAKIPPDSYASGDYLPGGFHAWRTLLEREGERVSAFTLRPAALVGDIDTLIVAVPHAQGGTWTDADQVALLRWVRDGGHLVMLDYGAADDAMELVLVAEIEIKTKTETAREADAASGADTGARRRCVAGTVCSRGPDACTAR